MAFRNDHNSTSYSKLPEQIRDVMTRIVASADENFQDSVPQRWVRDPNIQNRKVPKALINDLLKMGFLKAEFDGGPVYKILKWPKDTS